jgi:hypothetical protein
MEKNLSEKQRALEVIELAQGEIEALTKLISDINHFASISPCPFSHQPLVEVGDGESIN